MKVVHSPLGQRWHAAWQKALRAAAAERDAPGLTSRECEAAYEEFQLIDEEVVRASFETPSEALTKVDSALLCAWTTVPPDELILEGWPYIQHGRHLLI